MNPYSEDRLIEQPAIQRLVDMGWKHLEGKTSHIGRNTPSDVVLATRLREALTHLNPTAPPDAIEKAIETFCDSRIRMSLVEANREIYSYLKDGISVTTINPENADETTYTLQVIGEIDGSELDVNVDPLKPSPS